MKSEPDATEEILDSLGLRRIKALMYVKLCLGRPMISKESVTYWVIPNSCNVSMWGSKFFLGMPESHSLNPSQLMSGFELLEKLAERYPKVRYKLSEPMEMIL